MTFVGKLDEVRRELLRVTTGNVPIADGIIPPLVFVVLNNVFSVGWAAAGALLVALVIVTIRLLGKKSLRFAVAGLGGTALAVFFALRSGDAREFFIPGLVSGAATTVGLLVTIVVRRPGVAWMSWLTHAWPIEWYWHPKVRPAYSKTTLIWVGFFAIRTTTQWILFINNELTGLGIARIVLGWPSLVGLLVLTYLLGRRWLSRLEGPSVDEFLNSDPPPWRGQAEGF